MIVKLLITFSLFLYVSIEANIRIMPLGDSITYDDAYRDHPSLGGTNPRPSSQRHGYRNHLWYMLKDAGYQIDFVGSRVAGEAVSPSFDPDNEGYPGWTSAQIELHVYGFLQNNEADIILFYIGANDWSNSVDHINGTLNEIDRYESNYHHHIKVILARIVNRREYHAWMHQLNINIQNLANHRVSQGDDIVVVDMENSAGIRYPQDFQDRTHPSDTGYKKIAKAWFYVLKPYIVPDYSWLVAIQSIILN